MEKLGVSWVSLREAFRAPESMGKIQIQRNAGSFVVSPNRSVVASRLQARRHWLAKRTTLADGDATFGVSALVEAWSECCIAPGDWRHFHAEHLAILAALERATARRHVASWPTTSTAPSKTRRR